MHYCLCAPYRNSNLSEMSEDWGLESDESILEFEKFDEEDTEVSPTGYEVKYLGCTTLSAEQSQKATSAAIKSVLASTNKLFTGRRNSQQVILKTSPKGIEIYNKASGEMLKKISIYKISCCSIDGAYNHIFSFAASGDDEILTCYVFMCPKKKVTQKLSISVAKAFEAAYHDWKESVERNKIAKNSFHSGKTGESSAIKGNQEISVIIERSGNWSGIALADNGGDDENNLLIDI